MNLFRSTYVTAETKDTTSLRRPALQAGITMCTISVAQQTHNHSRVAAFRALQVLEELNRVGSIPERNKILKELLDATFVDGLPEVSIWLV